MGYVTIRRGARLQNSDVRDHARKGIKRVQMNTRKVLSDIAGIRTEKVLYQVMNAGANHAALITPVKSSTLINSQYKNSNQCHQE